MLQKNNRMNTSAPLLVLALLTTGPLFLRAQRPTPIQINSLIARIPIPESSQGCYKSSTIITDADGISSIKDEGVVFNSLTDQLEKINKAAMDDMQSGRATNPAMAASSGVSARPPAANVALMQELGKAQGSIMQITLLTNELSGKMGQLQMAQVPAGPNCPEVRQGSYVGPTCACELERSVNYEQKRIAARDAWLQQAAALFKQYIPRIKDQVAFADKVENDANYGQDIKDPTTLQMLWSVQRQALGGYTSLLAIATSVWKDGAGQYLNLVNAKNRHCK
jgi:hypothetical protein